MFDVHGAADPRTVEKILDSARWAPSGDNTQPWRFEVAGDLHAVVHGFDTRDHCVYDLDGHPSQMSIGALLETASIAATAYGLFTEVRRRTETPDSRPTFDLYFRPDPGIEADPLIAAIASRSVQRRPMATRRLTPVEKQSLEASVAQSHRVIWLDGFNTKLKTARLMFGSAKLRLTMPEAYRVHSDVIEWDAQFSVDRIPDQALGVNGATTRLMRFVMHSWERVEFFNTFLAGTWAPRIQMDFIPALACAAHFVLQSKTAPNTIDDYVSAGRALQRFWLTATHLGLQLQPELTPLIFARYAREKIRFSTDPGMAASAQAVERNLRALIGDEASRHAVFFGRVGAGPPPTARSTRLDLAQLLVKPHARG